MKSEEHHSQKSYSLKSEEHPLRTLIIIPTYNEAENLPSASEIFFYAPTTDVLIVDDNSPDGTGELVEKMKKEEARIAVLHRSGSLNL